MSIRKDTIVEVIAQVPLFAQLNPREMGFLADAFVPMVFQDGDVIFNIGDVSEAMFVVCEGQVVLSYDQADDEFLMAKLSRGDIFGEEALLYDDLRDYRAVASGATIVLALDYKRYFEIHDELPDLEASLDVSIQSRRLATVITLPWLHEDEFVHVMTRRHPAILWSKLAKPVAVGVFVLLATVLMQMLWLPGQVFGWVVLAIGLPASLFWLVWAYVDWRNDYFIVTNKRVVWMEKIAFIYESRQEAPLRTIMSVGVHRTRLGTLLGFGDVVVTTYVGTLRLREIAHTEVTASMIESYWQRSQSVDRRDEARIMSRKLQEKLNFARGAEDVVEEEPVKRAAVRLQAEEKEPGFFAWLFSGFIRLRHEQDGAIIYRKHWFVLVRGIWLPGLLMIGAVAVAILRMGGRLSFVPITETLAFIMLFLFAIFLWMVYVYVDWRNDIFMLTLDQIIDLDRKPLGKTRRRSAPLENVLSIEYERLGFWGYLFNFGTVYIVVGNSRLSFDHVYNPSRVQEDIFYRMGERLETVRQFEIDAERERFSEWIATYHRKAAESQATRRQVRGKINPSE